MCTNVRCVPKSDSDSALNPYTVARPQNSLLREKEKSRYFQREGREGNLYTAFKPREKSRSSSSDYKSQLTDRHSGAFQSVAYKRRRNSQKQSPKKFIHPVLHPYLNSSVHFAQFSANLDNIPNMTRSWINSSPWYVAERKRHFSFFFPLNLGSEVTAVEKVEKEAVCHRKPCLQKSRILSRGDKRGKQLSVRFVVMFFCSEIFSGWLPALCTAMVVYPASEQGCVLLSQ